MAKKPDYQKAVAELNRIARAELGGPERKTRHRHMWTSHNKLERGKTITFYCAIKGCDKTKQKFFPLLEPDTDAGRGDNNRTQD